MTVNHIKSGYALFGYTRGFKPRRVSALAAYCGFLVLLLAGLGSGSVYASSGSYATTGTGTYAQSLWWLDFSGYSNATAAGGQPYNFALPSGAGSLSTTLTFNGNGTLAASSIPAWTGGGAFGHGAYNGIAGNPDFYWLGQTGIATLSLTAIAVKDAAGNARSFVLYAADGENTNSGESIAYTSSSAWRLIDTVNYYANFNGAVPGIAGTGTSAVTETAPTSADGSYNASIILGTQSPTQVSVALSGNEAALFAVAMPTVTLSINVAGRISSADQFTASIAYTSPVSSLKTASTTGTGTSVSSGATSVIGTNSITLSTLMAAGSASPLSYYSGNMACTNSGPGAASYAGSATPLPNGAGTSFTVSPQAGDSIVCTLTLTPPTQTLTGTVYGDANHDASLDNGESGAGIAGLYVKLASLSGGVCQTPATTAAPVTSATGAYSVAGVAPGTYCLILTNSNTLANTTATLPPGTVGTEAAGGIRTVTVSASPTPVQNFGLFSGAQLNLKVFADTGIGGGSANDGVQDGGEIGIAGVTVTATAGATAIASATSTGSGGAVLWLPSSSQGATITLTPVNPSGDIATGGSAGTTGGSYARPAVSFTFGAGVTYSGVSFGLVPPNSLAPSGAQAVRPGGIVFYPHTFTAGSGGQVTFATSAVPSPVLAGWSEVIYLDSTCSGQFSSADTLITAPITANAGQAICVLVKEFAPANAPANASNKVSLSATFAYSGSAAPVNAVLTQTDTTTVSGSGTMTLTKQVQNVTLGAPYSTADTALPGHTLQYQITASNQGSAALSALVVSDTTPAFTTFVAIACPSPASLPPGLTSCTVTTQPTAGAAGAVQWSFAGTLAPGAQTAVTFQVQVAP